MAQANAIFNVDGLVVVITGGGTGLGRYMAHGLASNGAHKVYITGRRLDKLEETAKGYENVIPVVGDATDKKSLEETAKRIKDEVGYINLLIANSGVSGPGVAEMPRDGTIGELQNFFWSYSPEDLNQVYAVNNTAAFFTAVAFLELLDLGNGKQKDTQSQIIFTASIAGMTRSLTSGVAYIQSKAGTVQLTKTLSTLLAKWNIRVNALAPGVYPSEMTEEMIKRKEVMDNIPARRPGSEEDMYGAVLFLASRAGSYINGNVLVTDGGRLGQIPNSY